MGAAHIVGDDLEFGLGVDPGPLGEQQIAAQLGGIGALRLAGHPHGTVEHALRPCPSARALYNLLQPALRPGEGHEAVLVGDLAAINAMQTLQMGLGRALQLIHPRLEPQEPPAGAGSGQVEFAARLLAAAELGQQGGGRIGPVGQEAMAQAGAAAQMGPTTTLVALAPLAVCTCSTSSSAPSSSTRSSAGESGLRRRRLQHQLQWRLHHSAHPQGHDPLRQGLLQQGGPGFTGFTASRTRPSRSPASSGSGR